MNKKKIVYRMKKPSKFVFSVRQRSGFMQIVGDNGQMFLSVRKMNRDREETEYVESEVYRICKLANSLILSSHDLRVSEGFIYRKVSKSIGKEYRLLISYRDQEKLEGPYACGLFCTYSERLIFRIVFENVENMRETPEYKACMAISMMLNALMKNP